MNYQGGKDLEQRTFKFAVRVIKMVLQLPNNSVVWVIGKQLMESATSIHSNIVHAQAGISRADFVNHLRIAKKEAKETKKWIEMLIAVGLVKKERAELILKENEEIICILVTSVKNAENKDKKIQSS